MAAAVGDALPSASVQADFYAKLSRLQDDVLARQHARIRLSTPVLEELQRANVASNGANAAVLPSLADGVLPAGLTPANANTHASSGETSATIKDASALALDDIEQERRVKRRRVIESRFKQGCEAQKKRIALENLYRKKDPNCIYYDEPHKFDTTQVLEQALQLVKPVSGLAPPKPEASNSPASSFDENEYYSSQVNSPNSRSEGEVSPPRPSVPLGPKAQQGRSDDAHNYSQQIRNVANNKTRGTSFLSTSTGALRLVVEQALTSIGSFHDHAEIASAESSNSRDESYSPPAPDAFRQYPAPPAFAYPTDSVVPQFAQPAPYIFRQNDPENDTDESYSPPAPAFPSMATINQSNQQSAKGKGRAEPHASKSKQQRKEERQKRKEDRRARNKEPATNAGSRANKGQRKEREEQVAQAAQAAHMVLSQSQGGIAPLPISNPRKRRRETAVDVGEPARQVSKAKRITRERDAASPIPYIKPEPQSPPPFANLPPSNEPPRELKFREDGRAEIVEVESPNLAGTHQRRQDAPRQIQYISDDEMFNQRYVERGPPMYADGVVRTPNSTRRPTYEGDLRRVASYQHAMRPASPEMAPPPPRFQRAAEDIRYVRAPSRIVSERPASTFQYNFDDDIQQISAYRPVQRREPVYYDLEENPMSAKSVHRHSMQAPPPIAGPPLPRQRVYRDENGEEWIAIPAPRRQIIAQEPVYEDRSAIRYVPEGQPIYESRQPSRQMSVAPTQYQRQAAPAQYGDIYRYAAPSRAYSTRPGTASQPLYGDEVFETYPRSSRQPW